ncbi:MAG: Gfo/Idh/MocA family protein, partial [Thermoanaerobaculia bacterium]
MSKLTPSRWLDAITATSTRPATGPIRVAVIGCGELAQTAHLPLLRRSGDFAIAAIADPNPDALAACATIAKRAQQATDYHELLTSWVADAVVLALPTSLHATAAQEAFDAGLHVYLEKPVASDLDGAKAIRQAWKASGRVGMIGHNYRFNPLYVKLKQMIARKRIGNPRDARMIFTT